MMGANHSVPSAKRGGTIQTRTIFLPDAEDVEFVMESTVGALKSNQRRPIMGLHGEPCIIQFEIGASSGTRLAYRQGPDGAGLG